MAQASTKAPYPAAYKGGLRTMALLGCVLMLASCSFNPNVQGKGQDYLQGRWQQQAGAIQQKLVTSSLYDFKFACDSFYLQINTRSTVNYGSDTCMNTGHWTEYVKGRYQQNNDTLRLTGQFCDANYAIKQKQDCFRAGNYKEFFRVTGKTDSLMVFTGPSSIIPIKLHLIKRLTCHPKPI